MINDSQPWDSIEGFSQINNVPASDSSFSYLSPEVLEHRFEDLSQTATRYELIEEEDVKLTGPSSRFPLLFVDINSGQGQIERVIIYEGDTPDSVAKSFALAHKLNPVIEEKLRLMLDKQMNGLL